MRCNIRRAFTFAVILFGTTLVILSLPRNNVIDDGPEVFTKRAPTKDFSNSFSSIKENKAHVVGQQQLPIQPEPPSLQEAENEDDLFDFPSLSNKIVLNKLYPILKGVDLKQLARTECESNTTLGAYWKSKHMDVQTEDSWEHFYSDIGSCSVYNDEELIDNLLYDLNKMPLKSVHIMDGGTQVKLIFTFMNDKQAVFKPMRFGRDYESDPNHFYFSDFERHNAEIATYHLDKVLGFRRAVPTVGRIVNITSDLFEKAEKKLKKTFFWSPVKNHCFVSRCDYYCDTTHAICGAPDLKEGSVQVFLPDETHVPRRHNKSPYRRTYSKKNQLADWQTDMNYCTDKVKTKRQYAHGRRLLDLVDLHILDYLIGNQDRHHYESFNVFEDIPSYAIHLDNGRAFGRTNFDDDDIMLPLRQCCVIRPSTLNTLIDFYKTPKSLVRALHRSLGKDPVAPILHKKHYPAIERRLHKVMSYIVECLQHNPFTSVVIPEYDNPNYMETEEDENSLQQQVPDADKKSPKDANTK
ncbi:unnamed protein product [Auanema sp. JU1783]|nr:unnamed protein product [Auanema sp. JU1783]